MELISICGHTFIDKLDSDSVVVDLGANRGIFSKGILDRYDCKVVAYEPSRLLCNNELADLKKQYSNFSFKQNAVWSRQKTMTLSDFYDDNGNTSGVANSLIPHKRDRRNDGRYIREKYDVKCVSINNILKNYEKIDILKIDIEGSEIEVLNSALDKHLSKCDQVCVEFHLFCQHEYETKITIDDLVKIVKKMENIGFESRKTNSKHPDYLFYKK